MPGRPRDVEGVKALAVAAQRCFADYRPGGMRVIAGSVILEPGLQGSGFRELAAEGREAGEGRLRRGQDRLRLCADGRGRQGGGPDHHLPHRRLVDSGLRRDHRRSSAEDAPARLVPHQWRADRDAGRGFRARHPRKRPWRCRSAPPATCAPRCCARGSRCSLVRSTASSSRPTRRPAAASCRSACSTPSRTLRARPTWRPEQFICAATGNNAKVYSLDSGFLKPGNAADIVLIDAPDGGTQIDRARGDQARRYRRGRRGHHRRRAALRRPQPQHAGDDARARVVRSNVMQDFAAAAH